VLLVKLGRTEEALDVYNTLTRIAPSSADAWMEKADILRAMAGMRRRYAPMTTPLGLSPYMSSNYNGKGLCLMSLKRYDEALAAFEEAVNLFESEEHLLNKADALIELGRNKDAVDVYDKAYYYKHSTASMLGKGDALMNLKMYKEAIEVFQIALDKDPGIGNAWWNLGFARYMVGQNEAALAAYDSGLKLIARSYGLWISKAMSL